jgi:ribosomal protein L15E
VRCWTLRDDEDQHHHGKIRINEAHEYIELRWKAKADSQVYSLGLYQLNLRGLLSAGYIRLEKPHVENEVRIRFYRARDGIVYLQTRLDAPRLKVAPAPM